MLASSLAAVQAQWHYAPETPSLVDLATRLAYGLVKNHGFVASNKRTAFIAAYTFLAMNRIVIQASQWSVVKAMDALVSYTDESGRAQERFTVWLQSVTSSAAGLKL